MWLNPQETADLVSFTEEILNGKLHFLCSDYTTIHMYVVLESMASLLVATLNPKTPSVYKMVKRFIKNWQYLK